MPRGRRQPEVRAHTRRLNDRFTPAEVLTLFKELDRGATLTGGKGKPSLRDVAKRFGKTLPAGRRGGLTDLLDTYRDVERANGRNLKGGYPGVKPRPGVKVLRRRPRPPNLGPGFRTERVLRLREVDRGRLTGRVLEVALTTSERGVPFDDDMMKSLMGQYLERGQEGSEAYHQVKAALSDDPSRLDAYALDYLPA